MSHRRSFASRVMKVEGLQEHSGSAPIERDQKNKDPWYLNHVQRKRKKFKRRNRLLETRNRTY